MSFSSYSLTPASNVTCAGINVNTGCPAGNLDNAVRQLMADGKELANTVAAIPVGMPLSGGTFTGNIIFTGRGAYRHNNDPTLVDGRTYWLPEGSALPASPAEGMEVVFYTP